MAERKARMQFKGKSTWVNQETGEVREVDEFERPVGRQEHFMITYLAEIISLIDSLGNKKMQVVKYMLQQMDKSSNTLIITTTQLAKKCHVSRQVVSDTLQILDKAGIIQRKTGAIMISPKLMNNKKASGEASMLVKYRQFSDDEEEQSNEQA